MKRKAGSEFVYQLFALLISIIIVHSTYVAWVLPNADAIIQEQLAKEAAGEPVIAERSMFVVMRDFEQEACFVLMLWALAIMGLKAHHALQ